MVQFSRNGFKPARTKRKGTQARQTRLLLCLPRLFPVSGLGLGG